MPVSEPWLVAGINDRAQLAETSARLNALIVRGWQLNGVTIEDPATTWIDLDRAHRARRHHPPGHAAQGRHRSSRQARSSAPTRRSSTARSARDAEVKRTDATLAVVGAGASVGPFSYLRPGTVLGADGKIGTFVETKNAKIGEGSKVPHLSYIGDATIGEQSNIGAGSIFANYDGVKKHHSEIGSHVRTGSHGVFVAPVRIGDGAYTGAGTVVRKDVPRGRARRERGSATQHRGMGPDAPTRHRGGPGSRSRRRGIRPRIARRSHRLTHRLTRVERTHHMSGIETTGSKRLVLVSGRAHPDARRADRRGARHRSSSRPTRAPSPTARSTRATTRACAAPTRS